jgi:ubiquitin fusion degradation protein 1
MKNIRVRPRYPNIDINNLFIEVYKALPGILRGREDINLSNSIILPSSALNRLSNIKNFDNSKEPILFKILNIELQMYTHCGVKDFTAEEGFCYLPENMFDKLCLEEGQKVNLRALKLRPGTFIKLQPHKTEFIENPNTKTILEYNLREYFCVTEGDTISVKFGKKIYNIDVLECKPDKQIRTLNCNLEVDFAPPKDYKEPINNKKEKSNIIFKSEKDIKNLTKEEINKEIIDNKFKGRYFRIDGKEVTKNQVIKIKSKKEKENNEENYDPRKCRININPRLEFKYVEL